MTTSQSVMLALQASMVLVIFCVGLQGSLRDVTYLLREPGLLLRSLLAMNVVMPLVAIAMALLLDLKPALEVTLFALALAPVPPIVLEKAIRAGAAPSYLIGLVAATAIFSVAFVPLFVGLAGHAFGRHVYVSLGTVVTIVATTMLLPLVAGVCVRRLTPSVAGLLAKPLSTAATALLFSAFVPLLAAEWRPMISLLGHFTLAAAIVFVCIGLAVGHLLGGPDPNERSALALSTSTRHPAVAIAIANDFPDKAALLATVLLVLLVGAIISGPYAKWRKSGKRASVARSG